MKEGASDEVYLPTLTGGQGVKISLRDTTEPKTHARIAVNGDEYEVYRGDRFSDYGCSLSSIEALGGGTGSTKISCKGKTFTLEKNFAQVEIGGTTGNNTFNVGDLIPGLEDPTYIAYVGNLPDSGKTYMILAKGKSLGDTDLAKIRTTLSSKIESITKKSKGKDDEFEKGLIGIKKISGSEINIAISGSTGSELGNGLTFDSTKFEDKDLADNSDSYYDSAINIYEDIKDRFGIEKFDSSESSYGPQALCSEYKLANSLKQHQKARELKFEYEETYPDSSECSFSEDSVLGSDGDSYSFSDENIFISLLSVNEPSIEQASAELSYKDEEGQYVTENIQTGEVFYQKANVKLTLDEFTEERAKISYECDKKGSEYVEEGKLLSLSNCNGQQISLNSVNLEKVAKVHLTPSTHGRTKESNFTFNIGIEKRSDLFDLSPEKASEKILKLNETINEWKEITENLGNVVTGMKGACLATSIALQAKTLLGGLTGEAGARSVVMKDIWNKKCESAIFRSNNGGYSDAEDCIRGESDNIEQTVEQMQTARKTVNENIEAAQNLVDGEENTQKIKEAYLVSLQKEYPELRGIDVNDLSFEDLKEYQTYKMMGSSSIAVVQNISTNKIGIYTKTINDANKTRADLQTSLDTFGLSAEKSGEVSFGKKTTTSYSGDTWEEVKGTTTISGLEHISDTQKVAIKNSDGRNFIYVLEGGNDNLRIKEAYALTGGIAKPLFKNGTSQIGRGDPDRTLYNQMTSLKFEYNTCARNEIKNWEDIGARVYTSDPYKDMPELIPFDKEDGWYVATQQLISSSSGTKSFADSGAPLNYYVCSVGVDGYIDGIGANDDKCTRISLGAGEAPESICGMSSSETNQVLTQAYNAIKETQNQVKRGSNSVTVGGMNLKLGYSDSVGGRCTDFMSSTDCQIMFNLCDPVVCPSSRCDLGGQYKVENVIQSGVIGSVALCLPNIKEGIAIPVCLTGIHAGIEGWTSILTSYRDCLQESIDTGEMTGICDEIHSVYVCDFWWKQVGPYLKALSKNLFSFLIQGTTSRGGGEYLFVSEAFDNAEKSFEYFTSTYGSSSNLGFGARSFAEIGSDVCKAQTSATYPDDFDSILEPDSPYQVNAWFDEMTYSDATVPPTSQYKVFYTIFAGNDKGAYYSVYLKSSSQASGTGVQQTVDTGYINQGETISETVDFTQVSGYNELCVRVNTKDHCGFGTVSTSFAINAMEDLTKSDMASEPATTTEECVSGTSHIGSLLTPNLQQGVEDTIDPELYNQGIVRTCSTDNPGLGVEESRWSEVGTCGGNLKCWVDGQSIKNSINGKGIEDSTLEQLGILGSSNTVSDGYISIDAANSEISKIKILYDKITVKEGDVNSKIDKVNIEAEALYDSVVYNTDKARILWIKAEAYGRLAKEFQPSASVVGANIDAAGTVDVTDSGLDEDISEDKNYINLQDTLVQLFEDEDSAIIYFYSSDNPDDVEVYSAQSGSIFKWDFIQDRWISSELKSDEQPTTIRDLEGLKSYYGNNWVEEEVEVIKNRYQIDKDEIRVYLPGLDGADTNLIIEHSRDLRYESSTIEYEGDEIGTIKNFIIDIVSIPKGASASLKLYLAEIDTCSVEVGTNVDETVCE